MFLFVHQSHVYIVIFVLSYIIYVFSPVLLSNVFFCPSVLSIVPFTSIFHNIVPFLCFSTLSDVLVSFQDFDLYSISVSPPFRQSSLKGAQV